MVAERVPIHLDLYRSLLEKKPYGVGMFAWLREVRCACGHPLMFHKLRSGTGECFALNSTVPIAQSRCQCARATVELR